MGKDWSMDIQLQLDGRSEFWSSLAQQGDYRKCNVYISKKATRKDFKYFHPKEMTDIWVDKYAYPYLNIRPYIHVSKPNGNPITMCDCYMPIQK